MCSWRFPVIFNILIISPLTPTRVVYVLDGPISRRELRASPRRIKPINDWRLDVELRL